MLAAACEGRLTEVWRKKSRDKFKVDILDSIDLGSSVDSEVIIDDLTFLTHEMNAVDSIGHVKGGKDFKRFQPR